MDPRSRAGSTLRGKGAEGAEEEAVRGWMQRLRRRVVVKLALEMDAKELLACFAGTSETTRLYRGVMHVLKSMEETAIENVTVPGQDPVRTSGYAARIGALQEAKERLVDLVERAKKAEK